MRQNFKSLYWYLVVCIVFGVSVFCLIFLTGCLQPYPNGDSQLTPPVAFSPEWLDSMIEIAQALMISNTASAPVNPYALPINIGLAGIAAMLEALRRKEKAARKHAEGVINGNGKPS